jgi:prepilin-type N-terminal cleavage/methylation domain-containing protein/prepilin-type processing-associated H-X9-DG protein
MSHPARHSVRTRKDGFTLIELLVVIAIISILAAMLFPTLARAKKHALSTACKNHLHQLGMAMNMYLADFHVYPIHYSPSTDGHWVNWSYRFWQYDHLAWSNASFHCPAYKGVFTSGIDDGGAAGSYGYNANAVSVLSSESPQSLSLDGGKQRGGGPELRESRVLMPTEMYAIMDARGYPGSPFWGSDGTFCSPWYEMPQAGDRNTTPSTPWLSNPPQHGNYFNVLSCDGHVAAIKIVDLFNPTNTARNWNNDHMPHQEYWQQ